MNLETGADYSAFIDKAKSVLLFNHETTYDYLHKHIKEMERNSAPPEVVYIKLAKILENFHTLRREFLLCMSPIQAKKIAMDKEYASVVNLQAFKLKLKKHFRVESESDPNFKNLRKITNIMESVQCSGTKISKEKLRTLSLFLKDEDLIRSFWKCFEDDSSQPRNYTEETNSTDMSVDGVENKSCEDKDFDHNNTAVNDLQGDGTECNPVLKQRSHQIIAETIETHSISLEKSPNAIEMTMDNTKKENKTICGSVPKSSFYQIDIENNEVQQIPLSESTKKSLSQSKHQSKDISNLTKFDKIYKNSCSILNTQDEQMNISNKNLNCKFKNVKKKIKKKSKSQSYCSKCKNQFSNRIDFTNHIRDHHMFKCKLCDEKFLYKKYLIYHTQNTHNKNLLYNCNICNSKLHSTYALNRHMLAHTSKESHACHLCSKTFKIISYLKKHIRGVHNREKSFKCSVCDKLFTAEQSLSIHTKIHNRKPIFKCKNCLKTFSTKEELNDHINTHKWKVCNNCEQSFLTKLELYIHLEDIHNQDVMNKCKICNYRCLYIGALNMHLATHSEKREFSCDTCKMLFSLKGNLKRHRKLMHGEKTMLKCDAEFSSKSDLGIHSKIHDKKVIFFECKLCDYKTTAISLLSRHNIKHKNNSIHTCNICHKKFLTEYVLAKHAKYCNV